MDIKWKVQVLDKMFDDTYVRNLYLKMKYNTLGRFSFDIRDFGTVDVESYFAVGNTIRIFWGDILKMEGVIQKLVRSTSSWGWSIYGCDLNGLLLDRTPNMPYELGCDTLTIANSVMYAGCDFPTSMWGVEDGGEQGAYVLRYKVGLNTAYKHLRNLPHDLTWQTSTGGEGGIVSSVTPTSIVDNTKTWATDQWKGAHCRMVTGAMKNTIYRILSNTPNSLAIGTTAIGPVTPQASISSLQSSQAIAVNSNGIYLACWNSGSPPYWIDKYGFDGTLLTTWGQPNAYTDGKCYGDTSGIAVDTSGNVYTVERSSNYRTPRIQKFDADGNFIKKWVLQGVNSDIGVYGRLSIYNSMLYVGVIRSYVPYIQVYSLEGEFISETQLLGGGNAPSTICVVDDYILIKIANDSRGVQKYSLSGSLIQSGWHASDLPAYGNLGNIFYDGSFIYVCGDLSTVTIIDPITDQVVKTITGLSYIMNVYVYNGVLYAASQTASGTTIYRYTDLTTTSGGSSLGIKPGDIYELTKGQTITWTKKYRVTNVKMTKNTHVINYNHTKDASKTANSISVSGRDDTGGQIYTSLDDSSPITTLLSQESILSAPISASDTTIPVHDTTGFASSGEAWIE